MDIKETSATEISSVNWLSKESDRFTRNISRSFSYFAVSIPPLVYVCHLLLDLKQKILPALTWKRCHDLSAVTQSMSSKDEDKVPRALMQPLHWTPQRENGTHSFSLSSSSFYFSSGSCKHQRQTWVGSKCSLKKPTTLRNGRPNSSPWWRARTKSGTRARIHFLGMEWTVLGNCHWATTVFKQWWGFFFVCFFFKAKEMSKISFDRWTHRQTNHR